MTETDQDTKPPEKVRCDACPVMCFIADGRTGACDRYANEGGKIIRSDPVVMLDRRIEAGADITPFLKSDWDEKPFDDSDVFVTAVGSGTTYPDYKPAPFIVGRKVDGADTVTVVTEAIFSYCGVKVKIDTDRHLGAEAATVRHRDEAIGHVMTNEYGSQMLSLGGVDHLTGGSKAEGRITCQALMDLCNKQPVELSVDDGSTVIVQSGQAPIVDGHTEARMRVGCGSATIGMFASQWRGLVDEVVVVDDHITGVVSEHQAGKVLGWGDTGIKILGRRSTPGRYFQVAEPGLGWGGTNIEDPLTILGPFNAKKGAHPGLRILMVSTTGEQFGYFLLDANLAPIAQDLPETLRPSLELIGDNCEAALCTVLFMGGAGGSLRSGATKNPVKLTRSVHAGRTTVSCAGSPVYVWPGGGITVMVDVAGLPDQSFGCVPTPALVAPIEFTTTAAEYRRLGGHDAAVRSVSDILARGGEYGSDFALVPAPDQATK
jgi:hypothetical protein